MINNYLTTTRISAMILLVCTFVLGGCKDEDDSPLPLPETKVYDLKSVADPGIEGTATFVKVDDQTTTITILLTGTPTGGKHPAHIHANTAVEGGPIVISLKPVDGTTGTSTTIVQRMDDGTPISFEELMEYDGHLNVHLSESQLDVIVAQGDIGQNELTGKVKNYDLMEVAVPGISGKLMLEERRNKEALATISLKGTPAGGMHPAHLHMNSAEEGGDIVFTFNPVNGTTGMSMTNMAALDNGTRFGYPNALAYDGYVDVHLSESQPEVVVARGNVGKNAD